MKATNTTPEATKVRLCSGHTRPICHISYSNIVDGTFWFVTSPHDCKPMLRNGETGDWVGTFEGHRGAVYSSAFDSAGSHVVTGSGDYSTKVWDAITGKQLHSWEHPNYIKSVDWWSPPNSDGTSTEGYIATGCADAKVRIFDARKYDAEPRIISAHEKIVKTVYFLEGESDNIIVSAAENVIKKWDLRIPSSSAAGASKPKSTQEVAKLEISDLNFLEYTHKHNLVAAHKNSITFIDPKTLKIVSEFETNDNVECASLSPDGTRVAAGSKIKAKEFTLEGKELENHRGHHGPIFHIRWAPDGNSFTTGAEDGIVRIWPSHDIIVKYEGEKTNT